MPGSSFSPTFDFPFGGPPPGSQIPSPVEKDLFGEDLLFTDDLQVTPKGDYAVVRGLENLRRSILRRLLVAPGEYKLNPLYGVGLPTYVKKKLTKSVLDEIRVRILDQLSRERRIDKVLELTLTPTTYGARPALNVIVRVQAKGRSISFAPFTFTADGSV